MGKKSTAKKPKATFFFPDINAAVGAMMARNGYACTQVWDADVVDGIIFTGGLDIHPFLYGELLLPGTNTNIVRDRRENSLFRVGQRTGKVNIGICRGAQLLCVLSGGSLWQDVDGHTKEHDIYDFVSKKTIKATSTHHQMMQLPKEAIRMAGARAATKKDGVFRQVRFKDARSTNDWNDPEVAFIEQTKSLCFQPHPEYHIKECETYFFECMERYIMPQIKSARNERAEA